ncbi:SusC/RagA family TonB-linked outer membrane protein [Flavobacterium aquidurense]|jgi:TonB-linked SusC/RagA family outer membrane protein|uniref:SusC/RagA family TonB-linked outer membrane protein n=1 Tax=Flavobacterium aquidurense TaxID=362413 RepID=UPI0009220E9D|nr:TonB-dependent receptor [Flavobacterium aquidurense]OXA72683.1 SusC/RagA family TonB-linked outer membrane protein [Flavobacterium aquidurense]SHG27124.1 TonB-linked outer membrane protein, SusC/RagA family [Flavobacterium frigidimaris]
MKLLTQKKPRDFRINNLSGKEIKLTILSLLAFTFQASAAAPINMSYKNSTSIFFEKTVKGKVTDQNGLPIAGANVIVKGSSTGVQTDVDGSFAITVADNVTKLIVTYIGMEDQEVTIGSSPIKVVMKEVGQKLEEVVVGYGKAKKKDLTGSVSSIGKDNLNLGGTISNVGQALQGRASGVQVQQNSYAPGSSPSIVIRGGNSLNTSNAPLYVVDGFITSTGAQISPNDIENIQILKDASSTAIYGARGGNGVILITTKKGKSGKMQIEAEISDGFQNIIKEPSLLTGQQYANIQNAIAAENGRPPVFPASFPVANTNWFAAATRPGEVLNRTINFSGSDKTSKFFLSGNYLKQTGALENTDFTRYSVRMGGEKKFSDKLNIGTNIYGAASEGHNSDFGDNILSPMYSIQTAPPNLPIYNADGTYYKYQGKDNALALLLEPTDHTINRLVNGSMFLDYEIIKGLTYHFGAGAEWQENIQGKYTPRTLVAGAALNGTGSEENKTYFRWSTEQYLTYKFNIKEQHSFSAMIGTSNQKDTFERMKASGSGFSNDLLTYYNLESAAVYLKPETEKTETKLTSYFGRLNYGFDDKYLLSFTIRKDGSSRFGPNNKFGIFPSGAIAWKITNEPFMQKQTTFSELKLRASYGITGNDGIGDYAYMNRLKSWGVTIGEGNFVGGTEPANLANPNLKWEQTAQTNFGLDMGFFNDKLTATIDVYEKRTTDALLNVPVGGWWGFDVQRINSGVIQNRGIELGISSTNFRNDKFLWTTSLNVAYNKQEIISLADNVRIISTNTSNPSGTVSGQEFTRLVPGKEMGELYGYKYAGVIKTGETYAAQPLSVAGDPKYVDVNGDGVINADDRTYLGNSTPHYTAGLNNDFRYGNFDLNIFFQGAFDYSVYNMTKMVGESSTSTDALNRWVAGTNENTDIPRDGYYKSKYGSYVNSKFVEDASYIRLKNVSIGYSIPESLLKPTKFIDSIRLYAIGQNLFTITNYSGNDPEVNGHFTPDNTTKQNLGGGIDFNSFPASRTFILGIKVAIH